VRERRVNSVQVSHDDVSERALFVLELDLFDEPLPEFRLPSRSEARASRFSALPQAQVV